MKRVLLLRHAKAVPADTKTDDAARALIERGRKNATRVGEFMQRQRYLPDVVLCSSSRRTIETWECVAPALKPAPAPIVLDSLYLASAKSTLGIVRAAPERACAVLVVGHNPGLEELALALIRPPATAAERIRRITLQSKFSTCALGVFDFNVADWKEIAPGSGALTDFVRPSDLEE